VLHHGDRRRAGRHHRRKRGLEGADEAGLAVVAAALPDERLLADVALPVDRWGQAPEAAVARLFALEAASELFGELELQGQLVLLVPHAVLELQLGDEAVLHLVGARRVGADVVDDVGQGDLVRLRLVRAPHLAEVLERAPVQVRQVGTHAVGAAHVLAPKDLWVGA
jgi:hypothetical protein